LQDSLGDGKARLTYAQTGIDRKARKKSQTGIQAFLTKSAASFRFGKTIELPFGRIFPTSKSRKEFYDFQIEGVGTKTLLAELAGKYDTIGIDAVAMAVNDVLRSGATPLLVTDAIHINKSKPVVLNSILSGIRRGAEISRCTLASGETGDVAEILHNPLLENRSPFDLFVSCFGIVRADHVITGKISIDDHVIGLSSSGIHSNGLSLARRVLLKKWGGAYEPFDRPAGFNKPLIDELLEPTRIYSMAINRLKTENVGIKAAVHITGDGLGKLRRLLSFCNSTKLGLKLKVSRRPVIFQLIADTARQAGTPISPVEMFRTFNMGIGFCIIVSPRDSSRAVDSLNKECRTENIGTVTTGEKIIVESSFSDRPLLL
jgi:phosphoribosylformylglycinamidine cyclo-ligase